MPPVLNDADYRQPLTLSLLRDCLYEYDCGGHLIADLSDWLYLWCDRHGIDPNTQTPAGEL